MVRRGRGGWPGAAQEVQERRAWSRWWAGTSEGRGGPCDSARPGSASGHGAGGARPIEDRGWPRSVELPGYRPASRKIRSDSEGALTRMDVAERIRLKCCRWVQGFEPIPATQAGVREWSRVEHTRGESIGTVLCHPGPSVRAPKRLRLSHPVISRQAQTSADVISRQAQTSADVISRQAQT